MTRSVDMPLDDNDAWLPEWVIYLCVHPLLKNTFGALRIENRCLSRF